MSEKPLFPRMQKDTGEIIREAERRVCATVWETFLAVFQEVQNHRGDGTYTAESALEYLRAQLDESIAYSAEEV